MPALTLTAPPRPPDAAPEPIVPPPFPLLAEPALCLGPRDAQPLALATTTAPDALLLRPFARRDRNVTSRRRRAGPDANDNAPPALLVPKAAETATLTSD